MGWSVKFLDERVLSEFKSLSKEQQARFQRLFRLVEGHGPRALVMPLARHVRGAIWELRVKDRSGQARGLYVVMSGQRLVVLRFFVKKTQKTPARELDLAERRLRDAEDD